MTIISLKHQSQAINGHYCMNYSINDINLSSSDTNLSLSDVILSLDIKQSQRVKNVLDIKDQFSDVTEDITHFYNQCFTTDDNHGYYIGLSKNVSGQASRYLLAFFVPDNSAASQAVTMPSSTTLRAHLSVSRGHSLISIASHLLTDYDGLTLQNTIAVRRICRAVTNVTESKTRHPILLPYSVAFTQKTLGGYHA